MDSANTPLIPCPLCDQKLMSKDSLRGHLRRHKKDVAPKSGAIEMRIFPNSNEEMVNEHLENQKDDYLMNLKRKAQEVLEANDEKLKRIRRKDRKQPKTKRTPSPIKTPMQCRLCKARFTIDRDLALHMAEEHPTCLECRKQFPNKEEYSTHEHPYCKTCEKSFPTVKDLDKHLKTHPKCQQCGDVFLNKAQLQIHWNKYHRRPSPDSSDSEISWDAPKRPRLDDDSSTPSINSDGTDDSQLESESHDESDGAEGDEDSQSSSDDEDSDASTISASKEVVPYEDDDGSSISEDEDGPPPSQQKKCPVCYRKFASQARLDEHYRDEHGPEARESRRKTSKKNKIKKPEGLFICAICEERFPTQSLLDKHIDSEHGAEAGPSNWKPAKDVFECKICKDILKTKDGFIEHMKNHQTDCTVCAARFGNIVDRDIHISMDHPKCRICDIRFPTNDEFIHHNLMIHPTDHSYDGALPSESEDDEQSDEDDLDVEDRLSRKHINCVTIDKFLEIHELIEQNQFETLANDEELLEALQIIFKGVLKGYIPICTHQRLALTKPMKKLLYSFGTRPSSTLLLRNKTNLKRMFSVLWESVNTVINSFMKFGV